MSERIFALVAPAVDRPDHEVGRYQEFLDDVVSGLKATQATLAEMRSTPEPEEWADRHNRDCRILQLERHERDLVEQQQMRAAQLSTVKDWATSRRVSAGA